MKQRINMIAAGMSAASVIAMVGCAGGGEKQHEDGTRATGGTLSAEDFAAREQARREQASTGIVEQGVAGPVVLSPPKAASPRTDHMALAPDEQAGAVGNGQAGNEITEPVTETPEPGLITRVGAPDIAIDDIASPEATDELVTLDLLVGYINGRPIYANDFLDPLDGKLRNIARETQSNARAWQQRATQDIYASLITIIKDELILAEARETLTPQQREGLRFFLADLEKRLRQQQGGAREVASARLQREQGRSLSEQARDELNQQLILNEMRTKIHTHVPWRRVVQEYERRIADFTNPGQIEAIIVQVPTDNAEARAAVEDAFAAGESFANVAAMDANAYPDDGGHTASYTGIRRDTQLHGIGPIDQALRDLDVGQQAGPIVMDDRVVWVYLKSDAEPSVTPLYEVQLQIHDELFSRQFQEDQMDYFSDLIDRHSVSDVEAMTRRLLAIATERYYE